MNNMKIFTLKIYGAIREIRWAFKYLLVFKNWWIIIADWLGIIKKGKIVILDFRNGYKCQIKACSGERNVVTSIFIDDYFMINKLNNLDSYKNIIDIGGHIGSFAIYISQFCKNARVLSFEPNPENYERLTRNIKMNKLEGNIISLNSAISDVGGTIKLYLHDTTFGHSTIVVAPDYIEVPCYTLENILSQYQIEILDLLKLNAEGAEYPILFNASKEVLQKVKSIHVQCHPLDSRRNIDSMFVFLSANGFRCKKKNGEWLSAVNNREIYK
jgi:FkbM family methyltransferase